MQNILGTLFKTVTPTARRAFIVGDRVLYPEVGKGKIVKIHFYREYKRLMYVIDMEDVNMKLLVPADKIHEVGVLFMGQHKG